MSKEGKICLGNKIHILLFDKLLLGNTQKHEIFMQLMQSK